MPPSRKIQRPNQGGRSRKIDLVHMIRAASRLNGTSKVGRRVACCPDFEYSKRFNRNLNQVYRMCKQHPKRLFVIHKNNNFAKTPSTTNSTWARRPPPTGRSLPWILRFMGDTSPSSMDCTLLPRVPSATYSRLVKQMIETAMSQMYQRD